MPRHLDLRASDTDRERVVAELREHAAVGRLTLDELSERTEGALVARTFGDLDALVADLPRRRRSPRRLRLALRNQVAAYVVTNGVLVGAWVESNGPPAHWGTGPEPIWPAWTLLGVCLSWGLFLVVHAFRRRDVHGRKFHARLP